MDMSSSSAAVHLCFCDVVMMVVMAVVVLVVDDDSSNGRVERGESAGEAEIRRSNTV